MAIPRRGLRDIRTHAGRVDRTTLPHRAYLKLSCLEMEKVRRGKERASASYRLADIDARFKQIEAEKAAVREALQVLEERDGGKRSALPGPQIQPGPRRSTSGFKLRY